MKKLIVFTACLLFLAAFPLPRMETGAKPFTPIPSTQEDLIRVKVYKLILDPANNQPVVLLSDPHEARALFIWIGHFEANAIHSEIQGIRHHRPLTHDLIGEIIKKAHLEFDRVIITQLKEGTFFARILMVRGEALEELDARPSDSIIMALKLKIPIYVSKGLFQEVSLPLSEKKEIEERYGIVLQELTPSLAKAFSFGSTGGALVSDVQRGSNAEKDGIRRGDIFVEIGGRTIENLGSMRDALNSPKMPVRAKIFRSARTLSITLHPSLSANR